MRRGHAMGLRIPDMSRRLLAAGLAFGVLTAPAHASLAQSPGPALEAPAAALRASLACSWDLHGATRPPVLLVAGTGGTPHRRTSAPDSRAGAGRSAPG